MPPSRIRLALPAALLACTLLQAAEPDADRDGVPDARDRCPGSAAMPPVRTDFTYKYAVTQERLQPGSKAWPVDAHGCEADSDDDGVLDSRDYCPGDSAAALAAGIAENGCPQQSDADGTPDYRDDCPGTPKGVATDCRGCPK
jgi:OOP family OmpA-OmpF porin